MNLPKWVPEPVKPLLEQLNTNSACRGRRRPIFDRLAEDQRMRPVYYELFVRRDRETGDFLYPAKSQNSNQSAEDAQVAAIREVLLATINAASDRLSVSKVEEIEDAKRRWGDDATRLRALAHDMGLAAELEMLGFDDPVSQFLAKQDLQALQRVANWLEHLKSSVRPPDDPLVVHRHRGDPIVRAVQITIGGVIEEQFGERLDGTAANLTRVALDVETSPRVSRSALAERKPH
jgi:hypothetical protein